MIKKFICLGCVGGPGPETCPEFKPESWHPGTCEGHVLGTFVLPIGCIALGLPKGFNRPGSDEDGTSRNKLPIHVWPKGTCFEWTKFNVPVWAMVKDGFLFVRTYSPRINFASVDVVEGGDLSMVPGAVDVGDFWDEID